MGNRLTSSTSLYLKQHSEDPVDWWPWCDEALEEAKRRDLPLFISIGYSACHWCHVMAHESFQDPAIAAELNAISIPIKVDREERPDLDEIYMEAVQAVRGSGGWPMSIFAFPDGRPFFAATYVPPRSREGMPGFHELLGAVKDIWGTGRDRILEEADSLSEAIVLRTTLPRTLRTDSAFDADTQLDGVTASLIGSYDHEWGGFGRAPKFPQPHLILDLLYAYFRSGDESTLDVALQSLRQMARGGIHDHLDGGFARYSTDRFWLIPHFEKMLYDQSGLLEAYATAYSITKDEDLKYTADRIFSFVEERMVNETGGVSAAIDADSDGEEGAYYIFRIEEIHEVLQSAAAEFIAYFGVTKSGNFEGRNILHRPQGESWVPPASIAASMQRLLAFRSQRNPPSMDRKVITEWNADWATSLFRSARATSKEPFASSGIRTLENLLAHATTPGWGLRRLALSDEDPQGASSAQATSGDYASLVRALVEGYMTTQTARYLTLACGYADALIENFLDQENGGFFTAARTVTLPVARLKDFADGAVRSANAVAASTLNRLYHLTGERRYLEAADSVIAMARDAMELSPVAYPSLVLAAVELASGLRQLVIPGDAPELLAVVEGRYLPDLVIAAGDGLDAPVFNGRSRGVAYLCEGFECRYPTDSPLQLHSMLLGDEGEVQ